VDKTTDTCCAGDTSCADHAMIERVEPSHAEILAEQIRQLSIQFQGTVAQIAQAINVQAARLDRLEALGQTVQLDRRLVEELIKRAIEEEEVRE
jgi:hypothetical protein